ncbi:MAG: hypothetical protein NT011_01975 [Kiritimatiellaeota bacterium]|nr:hypothetical protein [Kiritimatiellota bacterium]
MKWLGIGIGSLLVMIILASLIMNVIFGRELQLIMRELKVQGKPLTIAEFAPTPVPAAENAAPLLKKATEWIPSWTNPAPSAMKSLMAIIETNDIPRKVCTDITGWTEAQREAGTLLIQSDEIKELYALLKQAAQCPHYSSYPDWSQAPTMLVPKLAGYLMPVRMLVVKAGFEGQDGNLNQAMDTILIGLQLSNKLSDEPILITQAWRIVFDLFLTEELERIANASELPTEQTQALIAELSLHTDRAPWSKAMDQERLGVGMRFYDHLMHSAATEFLSFFYSLEPSPNVRWILNWTVTPVLRPLIKKDYVVYLKLISEIQRRFELPYYQIADVLKQKPIDKQIPRYAFITRLSLPNFDKISVKVTQHQAQMEICRVGLALKLFEQKNGAYPDTLNKLAPEFLDTIPVDPFTGKALIYRKAKAGFILYSLGPNLQDDNGTPPTPKWDDKGPCDFVWKCTR